MAEIQDLTATAGSHARFPEAQAPSTLNDGARAVEGIISRWFFDTNYSVVCTVSGTVVQITANRVSLTLTGTTANYTADLLMAFTVGSAALSGPNSVNINGIGPIPLRDNNGVSLSATYAQTGTRVLITKDDTNNYFRLLSPSLPQGGGTWTPTDASGASLALTVNSNQYVKIGQLVFVSAHILYPVTADGSDMLIGGLPFTSQGTANAVSGGSPSYSDIGTNFWLLINSNATTISVRGTATGGAVVNSTFSAKTLRFGLVYRAAA